MTAQTPPYNFQAAPTKDGSYPSESQQKKPSPIVYYASKIQSYVNDRTLMEPVPVKDAVKIVCMSDLHSRYVDHVPDGDIFIFAGDLSADGTAEQIQATIDWIKTLPHAVKIVVGGNHDKALDPDFTAYNDAKRSEHNRAWRARIDWGSIKYAVNEQFDVHCARVGRSFRVYASPYSAPFKTWAFQFAGESDFWADRVAAGTDIVVSHGPPRGHLDTGWGCASMLHMLYRVRPRLHVFGHVHESRGIELLSYSALQTAFEQTVAAGGGLGNLVRVLWAAAHTLWKTRTPREAQTQLVNAAVSPGFWDDKKVFAPQVVYL